ELSGMTTFQYFDGYGRPNRLGDHMIALTAGFTFHLGKTGWKRAVDATPYIRQNEWLVDYANLQTERSKRYEELHDRNRLAELKKILEIEGLLDKYGHLINEDGIDSHQSYPRNNYSGLNSLRARLRNRHWDGISPLDSASIGYDNTSAKHGDNGDDSEKPGKIVSGGIELIQAGDCIGSPVYFFFNLNTAHLTDASQMLNLDELARVAKKYGLSVKVTGAADSSTGTPVLNGSLSTLRADHIVAELEKRGIPIERIVKVSRGGIADHVPVEANRHTKVELFL
ncbi:OmpA family protein, partial [uncultured Bacteroides sp.]|uniref:OmpA family protein n=1 Tax=uncultured Bacteroides sp. TaxID=162156 RepID=UPI0026095F11